MEMPIVLFVDDEPNILKTLRRLFMDEEYDIHTADNGREALALIEGGLRPTLIVSDQRMPEMGGAEFLARASQLLPDSIRMVLTGYADINAAVAAINQGGIYRYILKPWNDDDLKLTVREALIHYNLVAQNRVLTRELAEKNHSLAQMNEQLEEMVRSRTQELHQKVRELEGRDTIQQFLLHVHPLADVLQTVLTVVVDVCGLSAAAYYAVGDDGVIDCLAARVVAPAEQQALQEEVAPLLHAALPRLREEGPGEAGGGGQMVQGEAACYALVPVATASKFFGVLVASRPPERPLLAGEMATIAGFAMQAAIGVNDCHVHDHYDEIQTSLDDVLQGLSEV